jgi:hypothetical protein
MVAGGDKLRPYEEGVYYGPPAKFAFSCQQLSFTITSACAKLLNYETKPILGPVSVRPGNM